MTLTETVSVDRISESVCWTSGCGMSMLCSLASVCECVSRFMNSTILFAFVVCKLVPCESDEKDGTTR